MRSLILSIVWFSLLAFPVNAHTIQQEQDIGAVVHIDPGDEPYAGEPTTMSIQFKDSHGVFDSSKCICSVVVKKGSEVVFSSTILENNTNPKVMSAHLPITFPSTGAYTIIISGTPESGASFDSFSISYPIDVQRNGYATEVIQDLTPQLTKYLPYIFIPVFFSIILYLSIQKPKKRTKK